MRRIGKGRYRTAPHRHQDRSTPARPMLFAGLGGVSPWPAVALAEAACTGAASHCATMGLRSGRSRTGNHEAINTPMSYLTVTFFSAVSLPASGPESKTARRV
jgi:hypothetical protein